MIVAPAQSHAVFGPHNASLGSPGRVGIHAIRRVGHHEERLLSTHHPFNILPFGAVATQETMRTNQPQLPCPGIPLPLQFCSSVDLRFGINVFWQTGQVSLVGNPGEVAIAPRVLAGANIARQVGMVVLPTRALTLYVRHYLSSPLGRSELSAKTTGSVQRVINLVHLKEIRVVLPPVELIENAALSFEHIGQQIELLRNKNRNLRQTRDLLLPKVISGQVDVEGLEIVDRCIKIHD